MISVQQLSIVLMQKRKLKKYGQSSRENQKRFKGRYFNDKRIIEIIV